MKSRTLPLDQLLSFVTHDVYAPASMLRAYLHSMQDGDDAAVRDMVADAETLARELEVMLRLLQDRLRLATARIEAADETLELDAFLRDWVARHPEVGWRDGVPADGPAEVVANPSVLARALDDACFQLKRMGSRSGDVVVALEGGCGVRLSRLDPGLAPDVLDAAVAAPDAEWSTRLRRLPASGFPLRVAVGLVEALGGKWRVEGECVNGASLVIDFPPARKNTPQARRDEPG